MSLAALNRWRWAFVGFCALYAALLPTWPRLAAPLRRILPLGAGLWLAHDVAHGRWRLVPTDALAAFAGFLPRWNVATALLTMAGPLVAALQPEQPPSPHLWSGWLAPRKR